MCLYDCAYVYGYLVGILSEGSVAMSQCSQV